MYKRLNLFDTNVSTGFMISRFLAAHAPETEKFRSKRSNIPTIHKTQMLKKYFNSWKKYFLV